MEYTQVLWDFLLNLQAILGYYILPEHLNMKILYGVVLVQHPSIVY